MVVDSEKALAEVLAAALLSQDGVASAVAAINPSIAVSTMDRAEPDVVVVGMDSDGWDAPAFLRWASRHRPRVALVAMSAEQEPALVAAAVRAGADSWVSKQVGIREMSSVISAAARGESSIPPRILREVLRRLTQSPAQKTEESLFGGLTEREREILEYAVLGLSRSEIAAELELSVNTVRTHVQHILNKLGVRTTVQAVTLVLRERATTD
jgi:DNA-binding NarL/FixJ family response regulator